MNIKDIARLSGVGVSTVSRVINNHSDVKESTREKVKKVIKESNYIPNNSARVLKQNNTTNIGILVMGVFNPLFSEMTTIIGNEINKSKYTMIFKQNICTKEDDFDTLRSFIKEKRLCGVICLGGNFKTLKKEELIDLEVPIVLTSVNAISDKNGYSSVGVDNEKSAYEATNYLLKLGHKDIAIMIGRKSDVGISNLRLKGYKKALKDASLKLNENLILEGDYDSETAYKVMKQKLNSKERITAVFAISDYMAIGIAKAIVESGLKIGDDISVIGFDGMNVSEFYNPGITTISQPKEEIAEESAKLLLDLLKCKSENKHIVLETKLIVRESCKRKE